LFPLTLCGSDSGLITTVAPSGGTVNKAKPVYPAGPLPPRSPVPSVTAATGYITALSLLLLPDAHLHRPWTTPIHVHSALPSVWSSPHPRPLLLTGRQRKLKPRHSHHHAASVLRRFPVGVTDNSSNWPYKPFAFARLYGV